jgi:hypothetical protein
MRKLASAVGLLILVGASTPSVAQDVKPFEINMQRVKVNGGGRLADSKTYFIPTVYLLLSAKGSVWARAGGAQAHGTFFVDGLDKAMLQGLSRKIEEDLITKMRGAGYTVVTYADMKDDPTVVKQDRKDIDKKWGLPTKKDPSGSPTFLVASPTDEQAFGHGITGPVWPWRGVGKDKGMVTLVPEIWLTMPQMGGELSEGYKRSSAKIVVEPALRLTRAFVWGLNPKQGGVGITIERHDTRSAVDSAGYIELLSAKKTNFSAAFDQNSEWARASTDWSFTIDPAAVTAGVLRVGYAINDLIVAETAKAHSKP